MGCWMGNTVLALQVVGLGVGPITTTSSFVHNRPRLAACAYSLDTSWFTYGPRYSRICTLIESVLTKMLLC